MALARNLRTGAERVYTCEPRQAVLCAYAQERGDNNTWDYESRYGSKLEESRMCFVCGDWAAFKDNREG